MKCDFSSHLSLYLLFFSCHFSVLQLHELGLDVARNAAATILFRERSIVSCPPPRFGSGKNKYFLEIKQKFSAAPHHQRLLF